MIAVQVPGGDQRAEFITDCIAEGFFVIATDPEHSLHDISDHALGLATFPEISTQVFRSIAAACGELSQSDPESARLLALMVASTFDHQSAALKRFCHATPDERWQEPQLFNNLLLLLQNKRTNTIRFDNADPAMLNRLAIIEATINAAIPLPPELRERDLVGSKLDAWGAWELANMPAYVARIHAKLQERPHRSRGEWVAGALRRILTSRKALPSHR